MKSKLITATHIQKIETAFPGLEVEVNFTVDAVANFDENGGEVSIVFVPVLQFSIEGGEWINAVIPTEETRDGRKFLALLREAVRKTKEYKQAEQNAQPVTEYRHTMAEMFPKAKFVTPLDDGYYD